MALVGRVPKPVGGRVPRLLAVAAGLALVLGACMVTGAGVRGAAEAAAAPEQAPACAAAWSPAWHAAVQPAAADPALAGRTVRMIVDPQVTGSEVRLRLSNVHGGTPLGIGSVTAARSAGGADLVPGTVHPVTFRGVPGTTIEPGRDVLSDPVPLVAEAGVPLVVSLVLTAVPDVLTWHPVALRTSYLSGPGDHAAALEGSAFGSAVDSWLVLSGVEALTPRPVNAVVAVGDSLTDGVGTAVGEEARWSDALSRRLAERGGTTGMAVLNAGLSSNRLLAAPDGITTVGETPLTRFDRDVVAAGATDVVLHAGTNDIVAGRTADEITAGLAAYADRAREAGVRVFLTTIAPAAWAGHGGPVGEATRAAVNAWVLDHGAEHAAGVFDFAAAVADPADARLLAPAYDAGDGLHMTAAGYRALAAAVDPAALTGSPCLTGDRPDRLLLSGG